MSNKKLEKLEEVLEGEALEIKKGKVDIGQNKVIDVMAYGAGDKRNNETEDVII